MHTMTRYATACECTALHELLVPIGLYHSMLSECGLHSLHIQNVQRTTCYFCELSAVKHWLIMIWLIMISNIYTYVRIVCSNGWMFAYWNCPRLCCMCTLSEYIPLKLHHCRMHSRLNTMWYNVKTWLILPVVICLSQRLSHARMCIHSNIVKLRIAH